MRMWYGLESSIKDAGIAINEKIITTEDLRFILMSIKWRGNELDEGDHYMAENLNKWFQHKWKTTYGTKDPKAVSTLYSDRAVNALKKSGSLNENQKILNDLIEYAIWDLLQAMLEDQNVTVLNTSVYDDIKSWIDYILVSESGEALAIDLTLSSSEEIIDTKRNRWSALPIEYNISVKNTPFEIRDNKVWIKWHRERMEKVVLPMEPFLIQKFVMEYVDQIVSFDNPEEINTTVAWEAWELASEEYGAWDVDIINSGIYSNESQETVLKTIKRTQDSLLSALQ